MCNSLDLLQLFTPLFRTAATAAWRNAAVYSVRSSHNVQVLTLPTDLYPIAACGAGERPAEPAAYSLAGETSAWRQVVGFPM
jgi:hypothetical protein